MFNRLLQVLVLFVLLCVSAAAEACVGSCRVVLISGAPSWVPSGASVSLDFANNRSFGCTPASCLSVVRASTKTNLLPSSTSGFAYSTFGNNVPAITPGLGLLIEESRTNQLLNSATPATQTTGSLANGTYTLWVNGSGSATLSAGTATGCGTGVASQGTPVNFTTSGAAGTCTVTVTGSLNAFQLEAGTNGTSFIVTAGVIATRASDLVTPTSTLLNLLTGPTGTIFVTTIGATQPIANSPRIVGSVSSGNGGFFTYLYFASKVGSFNGTISSQFVSTTNSVTASGTVKSGLAWIASGGQTMAANGVTAVTSAATFGATTANPQIGGGDGVPTQFLDGSISGITAYNRNLAASQVTSLTQ
jgi:hypothetical protein